MLESKSMKIYNIDDVRRELIEWIREYFDKNGDEDTKAVIGISGGKDSSVVAKLCVNAIGNERVVGVMLPNYSQYDINVAYDLCQYLEIESYEFNIHDEIYSISDKLSNLELIETDTVTANLPARLRMVYLYAVANSIGGRVANTSNLSEKWVGYTTKFGDNLGDFSPLSNLTCSEVKRLGYSLRLPKEFIEKVPEDGICGKSDEDNLGFTYAVLDKYIRTGDCSDLYTRLQMDIKHACSVHKREAIPSFKIPEWYEHEIEYPVSYIFEDDDFIVDDSDD